MYALTRTTVVGALCLCIMGKAAATGPVIPPAPLLPPLEATSWQRPIPLEARYQRSDLSDAEPVDPAEFRVQTVPPPRPQPRAGGNNWVHLGPSPTRNAQVSVPPNNEVAGGVHRLAPHPSNADILYIGAVNGGIWKTTNATAASPTWIPLTDNLPSQSIGALALDPLDVTRNTLIAGTGRWSNFAQRGDDEIGVYVMEKSEIDDLYHARELPIDPLIGIPSEEFVRVSEILYNETIQIEQELEAE